MIVNLMHHDDVYALTRISRRMASIASPIFLAMRGFTSQAYVISLENAAFEALSVWRRSELFNPRTFIMCWFHRTPSMANAQVMCLRQALAAMAARSAPAFEGISLWSTSGIKPETLIDMMREADQSACNRLEVWFSSDFDTATRHSIDRIELRSTKILHLNGAGALSRSTWSFILL